MKDNAGEDAGLILRRLGVDLVLCRARVGAKTAYGVCPTGEGISHDLLPFRSFPLKFMMLNHDGCTPKKL